MMFIFLLAFACYAAVDIVTELNEADPLVFDASQCNSGLVVAGETFHVPVTFESFSLLALYLSSFDILQRDGIVSEIDLKHWMSLRMFPSKKFEEVLKHKEIPMQIRFSISEKEIRFQAFSTDIEVSICTAGSLPLHPQTDTEWTVKSSVASKVSDMDVQALVDNFTNDWQIALSILMRPFVDISMGQFVDLIGFKDDLILAFLGDIKASDNAVALLTQSIEEYSAIGLEERRIASILTTVSENGESITKKLGNVLRDQLTSRLLPLGFTEDDVQEGLGFLVESFERKVGFARILCDWVSRTCESVIDMFFEFKHGPEEIRMGWAAYIDAVVSDYWSAVTELRGM